MDLVNIGKIATSVSETFKFKDEDVVFLNTGDIYDGEILKFEKVSPVGLPGQAKKSIDENDILFSEIRPINRRFAFVNFKVPDYVVSTKLMVIRTTDTKVLPRYLYYFLTSEPILKYLQTMAESRSGTFPQITFSEIKNIKVPLPDISIQQIIIDCLDSINGLIHVKKNQNAVLEEIAKAIFRSWFVDFDPVRYKLEGSKPYSMGTEIVVFFPDSFQDSSIGKIPTGWKIGVVEDLGEVICGKTPPTSDESNYGSEVPFITIPDMHGKVFIVNTDRYLSSKGVQTQPRKTLPKYSICVSCIASPGIVAITTQTSQTNQQINTVVPIKENISFFCYWTLRELSDEIKAHGSGGSVTLNLNKTQFSTLTVLLPPIELMVRYHEVTEPLFQTILLNEEQNFTLTAIRDTLLPKLLSGEIRVKEAEKIVEAHV